MGVRVQRRVDTTAAILEVARSHITVDGPAQLSLRAVARDLDLSVSALYRYYASRDDLLTALITEAYSDCADAVEVAMSTTKAGSPRKAWLAAARAYRGWAIANSSRFLLIFGTPVPGYVAPDHPTFAAGTRIPRLLTTLLVGSQVPHQRMARTTRTNLTSLTQALGVDISPDAMAAGMTAWDAVHGHVMFELSGQFGPMGRDDGLFDLVVLSQAERLGL